MKKNRFALILIIIFCAFTLCGCATVSYTTVESEYGGVTQVVDVDLDQQQLYAAGVTPNQFADMKAYVASIMKSKQDELIANYETKITKDASLNDAQKELLSSGVETKIEAGQTIVRFSINFSSISCYYYFYDIDPTQSSSDEITVKNDSLFFKTHTQTTKTIFSNTELVNSYQAAADNYLKSLGLSNPQKITKPQFSYSYQTSNRRLKSDADLKQNAADGSVVHTWMMTQDETQKQIHFYTLAPRRAVWYGFALGGALVLIGALFAYNFYKTKKQKRDEVEIIEP